MTQTVWSAADAAYVFDLEQRRIARVPFTHWLTFRLHPETAAHLWTSFVSAEWEPLEAEPGVYCMIVVLDGGVPLHRHVRKLKSMSERP